MLKNLIQEYTPMNKLATHASLAACALLISACASTPNATLEEARSGYQTTKQNPAAARSAPQALRNAKANIDRSDAAFKEGYSAETEHYAQIAQNYVKIAQEQAKQSDLQKQVETASERRRELRLRAQREQTISAQRQAANAQQEATSAQQAAAEARARAAELERQLSDLEAKRTERGIVLTLGDVLFDTARAELKPQGFRTIEKLADFMNQYPERRVKIEGHTDSRGTAEFNQDLSQRRALSVSSALIGRNIDPNRITAVGLGESYPKATNDTAAGRQQNRRVEIIISDQDGQIKSR